MRATNRWSRWLRDTRLPLGTVLALLLASIEVFVDFTTWIELDISILYALPVILAAPSRNRRLLWGLALTLISATFVVYYLQIPQGAFSLSEPFFINRALASVAMLITTGLLHLWIDAVEIRDTQDRLLEEQNERLEAANRELTLRDELITQQNEELELRRREAEEASGRKTRLLRSMSHDIRSPINAITVMAEVIRRTAADPALAAEVPRLTRRLEANALSLSDLVTNVLDISAFDSGRVVLHESDFSLNDLLNEESARLLPLAQAKHLALAARTVAPPLWLRTDRTKLSRVVSNLLSNAIKFTETGDITIDAARMPDGILEIRVQDTGVGIAHEDLARVFEEFAQLEDAKPDRNRGWGLGLATCRRLVDLMGGSIAADSKLGVGSIFTVRLPASSVVDQPADTRSDSAA
jgi:signal transduction histidine kinase